MNKIVIFAMCTVVMAGCAVQDTETKEQALNPCVQEPLPPGVDRDPGVVATCSSQDAENWVADFVSSSGVITPTPPGFECVPGYSDRLYWRCNSGTFYGYGPSGDTWAWGVYFFACIVYETQDAGHANGCTLLGTV